MTLPKLFYTRFYQLWSIFIFRSMPFFSTQCKHFWLMEFCLLIGISLLEICLLIGMQGTREKFLCRFIVLIAGDTLGSFIYVPCEVMKQRMQVQGTKKSWALTATKGNISQTPGAPMYNYYNGMFHAGCSIWRDHGLKGLYAGYWHCLLVASMLIVIDSAFHLFIVEGKLLF